MIQNELPKRFEFPKLNIDMEKVGEEGESEQEWLSADGKYRVAYVVRGGNQWGKMWLKQIQLESTDKLAGTEMMRALIIKSEDGSISKSVYVDVFTHSKDEGGKVTNFVYSTDDDGLKKLMATRRMGDETTETLDFVEAMKEVAVRLPQGLPERIDVDETVRLFVEQLVDVTDGNFYMPVLIGMEFEKKSPDEAED